MLELNINENDKNQRLDKFLIKYLNSAPKSFIYKMLRKKRIKLNLKKATGSEILNLNDTINLYLSEETISSFQETKKIKKCSRDFSIIYEDENCIICSKPVNLVSQPDINNKHDSLNDQLIYYLYEKGEYKKDQHFRPSICNRLDQNTSGIVVFGKNFKALKNLNQMFKQNEIDKFYLTAVKGNIKKSGVLKQYFIKKENNTVELSKTFVEGSKEILTEYSPLKYKGGYTLLEIKLITGKTHQIRASFKDYGHPIIGDKKYADKSVNEAAKNLFGLENQFLHCYKVVFKAKNEELGYLSNQKFISKDLSSSFKNVINYFDYKII